MTVDHPHGDISILMMLYNHEPWIEDTLASVLAQTYQNFNLLIVDDGSSDRSYEIAKNLQARFKSCIVMQNDKNKGVVNNYFDCLGLIAQHYPDSQFFIWASPDDTWSPQYLEVTRERLIQHPSVVVCQTGYEMIYVEAQESYRHILPSLKGADYDTAKQIFISHGTQKHKAHYNGIIQGLIRFSELRHIFPGERTMLGYALCIEISMMVAMFLRGDIETTDDVFCHRKKLGKFEDKYPNDSFARGRASLLYRFKAVFACLPWFYRISLNTQKTRLIPVLWLRLFYHYIVLFIYMKFRIRLRKIIGSLRSRLKT